MADLHRIATEAILRGAPRDEIVSALADVIQANPVGGPAMGGVITALQRGYGTYGRDALLSLAWSVLLDRDVYTWALARAACLADIEQIVRSAIGIEVASNA